MSALKDPLPEYFIKMIDGHSNHARLTGKFWISLALISILTIMASDGTKPVDVPFGIGEVQRNEFFPFSLIAISIFIIGFGSSHIQTVRVTSLINRFIKKHKTAPYIDGDEKGVHIRDFFDSVVSPSFNRVAPLGQILQGKYQFYPEADSIPIGFKVIGYSAYLILKLLTFLVMYALPAYALKTSYSISFDPCENSHFWGLPGILFKIFGYVSGAVLLQLLLVDVLFVYRATERILGLNSDD